MGKHAHVEIVTVRIGMETVGRVHPWFVASQVGNIVWMVPTDVAPGLIRVLTKSDLLVQHLLQLRIELRFWFIDTRIRPLSLL